MFCVEQYHDCPRCTDNITYHIKWVKTSWTHCSSSKYIIFTTATYITSGTTYGERVGYIFPHRNRQFDICKAFDYFDWRVKRPVSKMVFQQCASFDVNHILYVQEVLFSFIEQFPIQQGQTVHELQIATFGIYIYIYRERERNIIKFCV